MTARACAAVMVAVEDADFRLTDRQSRRVVKRMRQQTGRRMALYIWPKGGDC